MNEYEILSEEDAKANYDALIDECYPMVKIGYSEFYPSEVLKECDPIAYRIGFADYVDQMAEEGTMVEGYC